MSGNSTTWLLVADASKARLFSMHKARIFQESQTPNEHMTNGNGVLTLISEQTHAESRKKGADLVSDKAGDLRFGSHDVTAPRHLEADKFAHELVAQIDTGRKENHFRDIVIVAPPAFMGMLCKHMPSEVQKLVSQRIEKDYTQNNEKELIQHLLSHF